MSGRKPKKYHFQGAFGLFLLYSVPSIASTSSLEQAVAAGLAIHPEVQSAIADAEEAAVDIDIAKGGYYPALSVSGGPHDFKPDEFVYDATASQMLYDWGRVGSKVDNASATHRKFIESVQVARDNATLDIIETFFDVLAAMKRFEAVQAHIQRLKEISGLIQMRSEGGYADRSELDRTKLELARADEQLALEEGNLKDAKSQYSLLTGTSPTHLIEPEPISLKNYLIKQDLAETIKKSPLLRKTTEEANATEAEVREVKASLLPQLNLEMTALRREIGGRLENDSMVSLRFRMDTLQGMSNFQRQNAAQKKLLSSRWRVDAMHRDIKRKLHTLFENSETLRFREQSLKHQRDVSKQVGELYREQFEVGHRDVIELLNVKRERFEIERQLINLRIEQKRIEYRAAAQIGLLDPLLENEPDHGNGKRG